MNSFFKFFLASILAIATFIIIFFVFIAIVASAGGEEVTDIKENSILHLTFENEIVDRHSENSFDIDFVSLQIQQKDGLNYILKQIDKAKADPQIKGIFIEARMVDCGIGTLQEIREALIDFKSSGKWILGYSDMFSQGAYYLASAADELYIQPEGALEVKGLSTNIAFLREALDNAGVEIQVIRPKNNKFKSAVEPFLLDSMSAANEEQVARFIGTIWNHMAEEMADSRGLSIEEFNSLVDRMASRTVESSIASRLVDGSKYRDEIEALIREKLNQEADEDIEYVSLASYGRARVADYTDHEETFNRDSQVAVIYASGGIGMGEGDNESIGSEGLSAMLAEARADSAVKAIVLRVNSGGGSALASDIIWRETVLCKETKPFIVSMGDVAASGGYYIACEADKIFANENTITGSIGVFGTMPNTEELMEDILGVHYDGVKTHQYADIYEFNRPLRANEEELWQNVVDDIYDDFTGKVALGRELEQEYVNSIGQGRVWSGTDALEKGLIDEFGGLQAAIDEAAELAGLEHDYRIKNWPKERDPIQQLMEDLTGSVQAKLLSSYMGEDLELLEEVKRIKKFTELKGVQARMPYLLEIK